MIWLLLLIPAFAAFISYRFFKREMAWPEYLVVFGVPALAILIGNFSSISTQTTATEYWDAYLTRATYYDSWDEWVHHTCSHTTYSGYGEHRRSHTDYYPCPRQEWHSSYCVAEDNLKNQYGISQEYFEKLARMWGTRNFREMNHPYYTKDGDAYDTWYDQNFSNVIPICSKHTYENKVQCSKAYFNFKTITFKDKETYGLYNYPDLNPGTFNNFNPILGCMNDSASKILSQYNGLNGQSKQLHMLLLVFPYQAYDAGTMQESYWNGGNKNEFTLCVGLKGKFITWTKVISWTEDKDLKARVADSVKRMGTFDAVQISHYMGQEVPRYFVRKHFKDFNFLTVRPTNTAIFITALITLILSVGLVFWTGRNDIK